MITKNSKEVAHYLKKRLLEKGADDVIIHINEQENNQIKFSNNQISVTKTWIELGAGIFATFKKKIITTNLNEISKESADRAIKNIILIEKAVKPNENFYGIAQGPFKYKKIKDLYDQKIKNLGEKSVDIVESGINEALKEGAIRTGGLLETTTNHDYILTSGDVEATEKNSNIHFSIRAFTDKDASGHGVASSNVLKYFDYKEAARHAANIALMAKNPKRIPAGTYDLIFEPLPLANLLEVIINSTSIFSVEAGLSPLAGKIGKQIGNRIVTIYDEGNLQNGLASSKFDDEGVPTRKTTVIDKGILKTYLHNTSTARRYRVKTTANAGLISPTPSNIVLKPGNHKKEELFKSIKKGLYITNLWYTRFQNHVTGEFSTIPRDGIFLIKNGKITNSVKEIRISDNILNIIKNMVLIGKIPKQISSWEIETHVKTPHAVVKNIKITKPE